MYDFDTYVERRNTGSLKWDVQENELPMWVADMDFQTAPEILEALRARVDHGVFGYTVLPDSWYDAYIDWWYSRHGLRMEREELLFASGVVAAIASVIRRLTAPGEQVLIQTPVYHVFSKVILSNGRRVVENPLRYENGCYSVDFADLEQKLADPNTTMMLLCNPHNPVGKLWERQTLGKIGELCRRYGVLVVADEIHCDLTDPGCGYVPFASVSDVCRENSITTISPTKTFNLASILTSAVMVSDEGLRRKVRDALHGDGVADANVFAITAAEAAFNKGGAWLDQLRTYIYANKQRVGQFLERECPKLRLVASEGTYLLWLDCSALPGDLSGFSTFLREETGLYLSAGAPFGGRDFLRMNIACPRDLLEDGLTRLKKGVEAWIALQKDLEKAKELLHRGGYTCVLCRDDRIFTSEERGVKPLLACIDAGKDLRGFSVADKVVGQGAAFLYVLLGVQAVYGAVMSKLALETLQKHGIRASWGKLEPGIRNRAGTGPCPMEAAVRGIEDPQEALQALREKQMALRFGIE